MTDTVTPVITATAGGSASRPARCGTNTRSALARTAYMLPVNENGRAQYLPQQPNTTTWTEVSRTS